MHMNAIGSVAPNMQLPGMGRIEAPVPGINPGRIAPDIAAPMPQSEGFGQMLEGLVSSYSAKDAEAKAITKKVLLGESDQLHQSIIAMQEASVAFTLMVEVRNKLVESYQEMMRMQV